MCYLFSLVDSRLDLFNGVNSWNDQWRNLCSRGTFCFSFLRKHWYSSHRYFESSGLTIGLPVWLFSTQVIPNPVSASVISISPQEHSWLFIAKHWAIMKPLLNVKRGLFRAQLGLWPASPCRLSSDLVSNRLGSRSISGWEADQLHKCAVWQARGFCTPTVVHMRSMVRRCLRACAPSGCCIALFNFLANFV